MSDCPSLGYFLKKILGKKKFEYFIDKSFSLGTLTDDTQYLIL